MRNHPPELWRNRASGAETLTMTRTSTSAALRCDRCGSTEVLSVSMRMEDGGVQFRTCTDCEATWWERDGLRIERTEALTAIPRR